MPQTLTRLTGLPGMTLQLTLCPDGQRFHKQWLDAIEEYASPDEIYVNMQDYFFHRNGIKDAQGRIVKEKCHVCQGRIEINDGEKNGKDTN